MDNKIFSAIAISSFAFLVACGGDSESSGTATEISSENYCFEDFGINDEATWEQNKYNSTYVKQSICKSAVSFLGNFVKGVSCVSVENSEFKKRLNITLSENGKEKNIWADIQGCQFKLGTETDYYSIITDGGIFTLDPCLCKTSDGKTYYREISLIDEDEESSSSSSSKKTSSSSKNSAKSSDNKSKSSSSESKQKSSSSKAEEKTASIEFVKIGDKEWTVKNLDVEVEGSFCYNKKTENCKKYGRMYTWATAMDIESKYNSTKFENVTMHQGLCPEGTHLPSHEEWTELSEAIQSNSSYMQYFNNQLGGAYDYNGYFRDENYESLFWSSTEYDVSNTYHNFEFAWSWSFRQNGSIGTDNGHKITGAYIRCVKDYEIKDEVSSSSEAPKSSSSLYVHEEDDFVQIGEQIWSKENLNVKIEGSRCYNDEPENCEKYGRMYTWAQAMDIKSDYNKKELGEITMPHQGICPEGMHLPSYDEWNELEKNIQNQDTYLAYFNSQLGGAYDYYGYYRDEGYESLFWSSSEYNVTNPYYDFEYAWSWSFRKNNSIGTDNGHKITGAYVRCIKNSTTP